jgi:hypothetical protein
MPKVFETSKARSIKQIELRLAILKRWSNEGIPWRTDADGKVQRDEDGEAVLEYVPTSLPTFCSWTAKEHGAAALLLEFRSDSEDGAQYGAMRLSDLEEFSRNTLGQPHHRKRKAKVDTALRLVAARVTLQREKESKASQIASLTAELAYLSKVVQSQEEEARVSRQEALKATTALRKEKQLRLRTETKLKGDYAELERKNAELVRQLAKVVSIGKARRPL